MHKWIYHFNDNIAEGSMGLKDIIGGKGASLAEIAKLKLPIPPGFTISTKLCEYYYQNNHSLPEDFGLELERAIRALEQSSGKIFGCHRNPLLVAVRSGAKESMPGMMDTILNLGINEEIVQALAKNTNNLKFSLDSHRRFLQMYGSVVLNIPSYLFEDVIEEQKIILNNTGDNDLSISALENIISKFKQIIKAYNKTEIPLSPKEQLTHAIEAVLKSWMSERAISYRKINNITDDIGTAVNIQAMVFGNMGLECATGVIFTRNPTNGENQIFGEYLINAQGEDVVAGTRTPNSITKHDTEADSMEVKMPRIYNELIEICAKLELHYKDMQDIEFTVENGKLYILQTRAAKRTIAAGIKVVVDMVGEKLITKEAALLRINPNDLTSLLHSNIDYTSPLSEIATGLAASPGAATGIIAFSSHEAEEMSHHHKVILVRNDTSPDDINGMYVSCGILTARGGMTSHAAVVARGMGKPCICSVSRVKIDEQKKELVIGDLVIKVGDEITIDGTNGKVFLGRVPLSEPHFSSEFNTLLAWADEYSKLKVRANAENEIDTKTALKFGACGIGLCRTEHMFFDKEKMPLVQEMIIASDDYHRKEAINALLPMQIADFINLFQIIKDKPINIRLLDPPLHEFLPKTELEQEQLAKTLNIHIDLLKHRLEVLREVNPMLGHRGCRLGISHPEIYKMQIEAIAKASEQILQEENIKINLEIMIPFISNVNELIMIKNYIKEMLDGKIHYSLGTMIELPRAALLAKEIARHVDYFSFGTNDLTQTTYGISRDDISSFLKEYLDHKIFLTDPFTVLDKEGVGQLIELASTKGKSANPALKLGVCGEHAGNPESIEFFNNIGMDYISCSPYRIPIARLAAGQSGIKYKQSIIDI